jgi:hypothetical protein
VEVLFTFGLVERPWDTARFGPSQNVYAYYDVDRFEPALWHPGYPNPAFGRMSDRDAAWMARIIAKFTDAHLRAVIDVGRYQEEFLKHELFRLLSGRRDKILRHYFAGLSPLTAPQLAASERGTKLCLSDLATQSHTVRPATRRYAVAAWLGDALTPAQMTPPVFDGESEVCLELPRGARATPSEPVYLIVDVLASNGQNPNFPLRVHLYDLGDEGFRVVGLERPSEFDAPH